MFECSVWQGGVFAVGMVLLGIGQCTVGSSCVRGIRQPTGQLRASAAHWHQPPAAAAAAEAATGPTSVREQRARCHVQDVLLCTPKPGSKGGNW